MYRELCVEAHAHCGVDLVETGCCRESHTNGHPHLNLLVHSSSQSKWKLVAERLLAHHRVHTSFGSHVDTWQVGVAFSYMASEHKPEDGLDKEPEQWKKEGEPTLSLIHI